MTQKKKKKLSKLVKFKIIICLIIEKKPELDSSIYIETKKTKKVRQL